jgi:peptidoglycan/LPS O-acetylase OafA/YrhL
MINAKSADLGRVLGATAIFYSHIGLLGSYPFSAWGEYAVNYFVLLSGAAYILFSRTRPSTFSEYWQYQVKRLRVLLPAYLVINIALYFASFRFPGALGRPFHFTEFLASASGLSLFLGWKYTSTVMWFMPFIFQGYLLLPLLDWCARRVHPVVLMLGAGVLSMVLSHCTLFLTSDIYAAAVICKNWSPVFRLPEVCAGLVIGRGLLPVMGVSSKSNPSRLANVAAILAWGVLCLPPLTNLPTLFGASPSPCYIHMEGFIVPMLILVLGWVASLRWPDSWLKQLRLLGLASFPFYLLHAAPLVTLERRLGEHLPLWLVYYVFCWLAALALTLGLKRLPSLVWPGRLATPAPGA